MLREQLRELLAPVGRAVPESLQARKSSEFPDR